MSLSQLKIIKCTKKQVNKTQNEENYHSIETDSEVRQVIESVDKDTKIVIISIFYTLKIEKNMSAIWNI